MVGLPTTIYESDVVGHLPTLAAWNHANPGVVSATSREDGMIKQVLAGVAAIGTVSGVALAQRVAILEFHVRSAAKNEG